MIVTSKELYKIAQEKNFAIPAANYIDALSAAAHIEVAEKLNLPLILEFAEAHETLLPFEDGLEIGKYYAEKAKVPVVLHLDHGTTKEKIFQAIDFGFRSVMIDASSYSFEENVKRTSTIVSLAHPKNICVEGELGHVGQAADGDNSRDDLYTNVEQAVQFVKETGVDALAVAIGTAHGNYPKGYVPVLDFERLAELKKALDMPLVLHGGSGSGEENIRKAVAGGINKINVCTDAFHAAEDAMKAAWEEKPGLNYLEIMMVAEAAIKKFVKDYIRVIGSNDQYIYGETVTVGNE